VNADLILAALGLVFAGVVKGSVGFGLPMIAAPVLTSLIGPRTAVVVMSLVNLVSAVLVAVRTGGVAVRSYVRLLAPLTVATLVGVTIGAQLLATISPPLLSMLVGLTAIVFALISVGQLEPRIPPARSGLIGSLVGLGAGLLGGTTSVFATPLVIFLHALHVPKRDFLVLLNVVLSCATLVQILSYVGLGLYSGETLRVAGLTAACVGAGVGLGFLVQDRINQRLFNRAVIVVIFLVGVNLVVHAWG
jgi:uncharacterized protein